MWIGTLGAHGLYPFGIGSWFPANNYDTIATFILVFYFQNLKKGESDIHQHSLLDLLMLVGAYDR